MRNLTIISVLLCMHSASSNAAAQFSAYLFVYFAGNKPNEEQIRFAVSEDGYNYKALNGNKPVIDSRKISSSGGVRDPHILRGEDGKTFYMAVTDLYVPKMGWKNYAMVLLKSTDLIHWTSAEVNIPKSFSQEFGDVYRVWAPQTIYDQKVGQYIIYFSMKQNNDPDKIYYAYANSDFTGLSSLPKQLYFPPPESGTKACIDADIIPNGDKFYLFYKAEDGQPGIKLAISDQLTSGYKMYSKERIDRARDPVEGSGIFKLNNSKGWILMYDLYTKGRYEFARSSDLLRFEPVNHEISMDFHPRHGTVLPITKEELSRLMAQWGESPLKSLRSNSANVKTLNIYANPKAGTLHLPVSSGTDLTRLDPNFEGASIAPSGEQNFKNGPVKYTVQTQDGRSFSVQVSASEVNNPILPGYFADPFILFSEKTKRFYIYPTTDGLPGWSSTSFSAFSSDNLIDWKDEGVILDLRRDVPWGNRNAWAPSVAEKKIGENYQYFLYYCAAQKIGVAVSASPTGPFSDSGKPLIAELPAGVKGGQQIDPDVFTDPVTRKTFLYWGNGYLAVAELDENMLSIKSETMKVLTPDSSYREGAHVFFRNGRYYFLWSEDDTRSENYRVRYATAPGPLGPLSIPKDNLVLTKDPAIEIYATGHNSTIQIPGKDEWFIIYHRFTFPRGKEMGSGAGFHREVCIDQMEFDQTGALLPVRPSHKRIRPLSEP